MALSGKARTNDVVHRPIPGVRARPAGRAGRRGAPQDDGEYVLYYRSKVVGGIYDDRFLLKVMPASERLLPEAPRAIPYEGAKEMLLVEIEDRDTLHDVVEAMWEELPAPKKRKKK